MSILLPTTRLVSEAPDLSISFTDLVAQSSGSSRGYHTISEWITCPEKARLRAKGIRRKPFASNNDGLNALDFGTLIHELCRIRQWFGSHEMALQQLDSWKPEIGENAHMRAALQLGALEQAYPLAVEPLRFVGLESEVVTNIRMGETDPRPCLRTVRYDAIVLAAPMSPEERWHLYSLERKTAARSGGLSAYSPQAFVQVALWNANAELVKDLGPMRGVIFEQHVKTKIPSCERQIFYVSPNQERMAREFLRYAENGSVTYAMQPDGTYPKLLSSCWGRFAPCDFISLCHEGITGDFVMNGEEIKRDTEI